MAKRRFNTENLSFYDDLIVGEFSSSKSDTDTKSSAKKTEKKKPAKTSDNKKEPDIDQEKNQDKKPRNYHKEVIVIDGEEKEKTISEKGNIIGRKNVNVKEKKKPITFTLKPDLYDEVIERAKKDHRTVSEYLAIIVEEHLTK